MVIKYNRKTLNSFNSITSTLKQLTSNNIEFLKSLGFKIKNYGYIKCE